MTARLRAHHMVLIGLGSALAAVTACSSPEAPTKEADAKKTTQASSVIIELLDVQGTSLGSCSGTLIAPKLAITAGHCITGVNNWKVTSSAGSSTAKIASTPWANFRSDLAHPEHSDVGLIMLNEAIKLDNYPVIATNQAKDGITGLRFHREAATSKDVIPTKTLINGGEDKGFKLDYLVDVDPKEWLDTGGAVLNSKGEIIGVVSGKGKLSQMLHVARVDGYNGWTKAAVSCSNGMATRTWGGGGGGGTGGGGYGGTPSTSSSSGGWGGWGGGGGSTWGSSSGGYGGGGGKGTGTGTGNPDGGATVPGSSSGGGTGTPGSTTPPGGSTGTPTTPPGTDTNNPDANSPAANTCPGIPVCEGECGAGSNGNNGGTGPNGATTSPTNTSGSLPNGATGNTGGGYDASGTPTTGGGYNKDGSQVPAGGIGGGIFGGGYDAGGAPKAGGGFNANGSQVPAGGVMPGGAGYDKNNKAAAGGGFNANGSQVPAGGGGGAGGFGDNGQPTQGGGFNQDGTMVPAGGVAAKSGKDMGPNGTGETCEGASDNPDVCPPGPDTGNCIGGHCGGCGVDKSCEDGQIDYGGNANTQPSGGVVVNVK